MLGHRDSREVHMGLRTLSRVNCDWHEGGSLYGWLRNWMGLEQLSMTVYDDPAFFEEMVTTVADCILAVLEKTLASGVQFDACGMWEDMAYNAGPLLSPRHFK